MSINCIYPKSCFCLSLRAVAVIIAFGGMALGLLMHVYTLHIAIRFANSRTEYAHIHLYDFMEHLMFTYSESMKIIFSGYLIYGAFRDSPMKTCYVAAWLIYEAVLFFMTILEFHIAPWKSAMEILVFAVFQFGAMYLVYSYYYNLPKKNVVTA